MTKPAEETEEEEHEAATDAQAAEEAAAAANAVAQARESEQKADEEKATVKDGLRGNDEIKKLGKSCRNTLFVVLAILCKDGMQLLVILILEMLRPFCTEHSHEARECRSPDATMQIYMDAAQETHMETVHQCADIFMKLTTLAQMALDTTFGPGLAKDIPVIDNYVQAQTAEAHRAVQLFY